MLSYSIDVLSACVHNNHYLTRRVQVTKYLSLLTAVKTGDVKHVYKNSEIFQMQRIGSYNVAIYETKCYLYYVSNQYTATEVQTLAL